jgi:hypothetical protein
VAKVLRLRAPVASEFAEQVAVIEWFRWWAPTMGVDARLLMASANGAYLAGDASQRARQVSKLKAAGMRTGVPDIAPFSRLQRDHCRGCRRCD